MFTKTLNRSSICSFKYITVRLTNQFSSSSHLAEMMIVTNCFQMIPNAQKHPFWLLCRSIFNLSSKRLNYFSVFFRMFCFTLLALIYDYWATHFLLTEGKSKKKKQEKKDGPTDKSTSEKKFVR